MLSITKSKEGDKLTVKITGEMDSSNASQFSETVEGDLSDVMEIFIDMSELNYTTSAGLREMLAAYQVLEEKDGRMVLQHPNNEIREVLELTGFVHFLEIED